MNKLSAAHSQTNLYEQVKCSAQLNIIVDEQVKLSAAHSQT